MFKHFFLVFAVICLFATPARTAVTSQPVFTQKDLARMIVDQFGWAAGLPKEPADRDYLVILNGRRTFHYEAEATYNRKTDRVTVPEYNLYGQFTGKGWLLGVSEKTAVNFSAFLPIGGEYTLKAVIKGNGFVWKFGDQEFRASSASGDFKEVLIGKVKVTPGIFQFHVIMPSEGAIDSYTLVAPDYAPLQPLVGWRFREPLTAGCLAEVAVSMMNLYDRLPESTTNVPAQLAAVDAALPNRDASATDINYLGSFRSRAWLRTDFRGAAIQIPVKAAEAGYYGIAANVMGQRIEGDVNGYDFSVTGKPYLAMTSLGLYRLESGENMLTLRLPPQGGVDFIQFTHKDSSPAAFMKLAGMSGDPGRLPGADEVKGILKAIYQKYPVRK